MNRTLPSQAQSGYVPAQEYPNTTVIFSEQEQQSHRNYATEPEDSQEWDDMMVGEPHSHNLGHGYNDHVFYTEPPNQQQDSSTIRTPERKRQANSSENSSGDAPPSKRALKLSAFWKCMELLELLMLQRARPG